jgi:hypothetical protein
MVNGGITPEQTFHLVGDGTIAQKLDAIEQIVINIDKNCKCRRNECDELYVKTSWLKSKMMLLIGFGAGAGITCDKLIEWVVAFARSGN